MFEYYDGSLGNEIQVTIDGKNVTVAPGSSILEAAQQVGIEIPTLCYLKGLTPTGACGMCAVKVEGEEVLQRACAIKCVDGMVITTNSDEIQAYREERMTEILEKHPNDCLTCQKTGGHCRLQEVSHLFDINPKERHVPNRGLDDSSPAMIRDMDKCIACRRCITVCEEVQKIGIYEYVNEDGDRYVRTKKNVKLTDTSCINCGQCVKVCPVAALSEKDGIQKALAALNAKDTVVVWQMAPAIQNTLGEEFGFPAGTDVTGKIAAAMKRLGGYAYTTDFSADVTIMEEGTEFIDRVQNGGVLPMMTSCCPGWVKYMEYNYPDQLSHLSSCKSPQQMFGALVKNFLPEKIGVDPSSIYHISIMPCVAKKYECNREEMHSENGLRDVDLVLTTREFGKLLKLRGIDLETIEPEEFDDFMGCGTGAGRIFGTTGGVMEAALRTVAHVLSNGEINTIDYEVARGYKNVKEAELTIGDLTVKVAIVNGIANAKAIMDDVRAGKSPYQFIEVMACPGGCLNGGGAPLGEPKKIAERMEKMYESDANNKLRFSHDNPQVQELYKTYLEHPCGHVSHELLHTSYVDRSAEVK